MKIYLEYAGYELHKAAVLAQIYLTKSLSEEQRDVLMRVLYQTLASATVNVQDKHLARIRDIEKGVTYTCQS